MIAAVIQNIIIFALEFRFFFYSYIGEPEPELGLKVYCGSLYISLGWDIELNSKDAGFYCGEESFFIHFAFQHQRSL